VCKEKHEVLIDVVVKIAAPAGHNLHEVPHSGAEPALSEFAQANESNGAKGPGL
jgi:hypothetical protein